MKNCVIGMVAETAIHFGVGRSEGVVDLPIAREAATDYPVIYGSGLKGAFRQYVLENDSEYQKVLAASRKEVCQKAEANVDGKKAESTKGKASAVSEKDLTPKSVKDWFGEVDGAGRLCFSDARILLYPVRCMTGSFVWITCRAVLERFKRDMLRFGEDISFTVPVVEKSGQAITANKNSDGKLLIEDQLFDVLKTKRLNLDLDAILTSLNEMIPVKIVCKQLKERLVVLSDDDFAHFVRFGVPIVARNVLEEETKKSKNLWYEEHLPVDTIMYCGITARHEGVESFKKHINDHRYIQVGGNATVGQGWFNMKCVGGK